MAEVRSGYRISELGQIPLEWEVKFLKEVLSIGYGKNQKEVEVQESDIPILGTGGVIGFSNKALFDKPSVLIGRKGTIDKPRYIDKPFWTIDTLFYTDINVEKANVKFIYYLFQNIDWYKYNEATGVPSLSAANISSIKFMYPTVKEQQKIAEILSTVDQQIEHTEKLIEKTKELKKGLVQKFFGRGDNEVLSYSNSSDWRKDILLNVCEFFNGKAHENIVSELGEYTLVNSKFISSNGTVQKKVTKNIAPLFSNDIVIVMSDVPNGKAFSKCFFIEKNERYTLNQRIAAIRTDILIPKYLYYQLNRNPYFLKFDDGVSQTNIRKGDLLNCPIIIPPIEEQKKIAFTLTSIDHQITFAEQEKEKYLYLKKALMQQLLTGKVRVKID